MPSSLLLFLLSSARWWPVGREQAGSGQGAGKPEALVPVSQGATCWHSQDSSGHLPALQPRPQGRGQGPGLNVQVGLQVPRRMDAKWHLERSSGALLIDTKNP